MRWILDEDGDIGISFWNILILVKYKDSVIKYWFRNFKDAPKYV